MGGGIVVGKKIFDTIFSLWSGFFSAYLSLHLTFVDILFDIIN